jgi:hypothetical protein
MNIRQHDFWYEHSLFYRGDWFGLNNPVNTPASCSGGTNFEIDLEISCMGGFSWLSESASMEILGWYLELGHNHVSYVLQIVHVEPTVWYYSM